MKVKLGPAGRRQTYVVDPETGIRYAIPMGGATDDVTSGDDVDDTDLGSSSGDAGSSDDDDDASGDVSDPEKKRLADEAAKYRNRAKEWRTKFEQQEARLRALENQGKSEDEQVKAQLERLAETEQQLDATREENRSLKLENGLLKQTKVRFRDPEAALALLNRSLLEEDDAGNYTSDSISVAFEALAKARPYLLEPKQDDDKPHGKSGDPNAGKSKDKSALDREGLASKFPALRNRVPVR